MPRAARRVCRGGDRRSNRLRRHDEHSLTPPRKHETTGRTHFYVVRASCFRAFVAVIRRSTGRSRVDSAQSAAYRAAVTHGGFDCDVLVIGAGPAGAAAAQLLAAWGRSVVLVHRPSLSGCSLAESLPSSTRKLLHVIGQLER